MLSLLLLVGAGLFFASFRNLQNQDYGFERTHLLLAVVQPSIVGYKPSQAPALNDSSCDRLSALPGVRSVALSATPPISGGSWRSTISISGYTPRRRKTSDSALNRVSGQYFETAGIPIVAGRAITPADSASSLKVAVVNQTLAKHYFPKGDALGRLSPSASTPSKAPGRSSASPATPNPMIPRHQARPR